MTHEIVAILEWGRDQLVRYGTGLAFKTVLDRVKARLLPAEDAGDSIWLEEEVKRLRDIVDGMANRVREQEEAGKWDAQAAKRAPSTPGFSDYVDEAMRYGAASSSEAKRRIFGSYIADRLQASSDDAEVALHRAMATTRELSEPQLLAMAAIVLVHGFDDPATAFANRAEADAFLRTRYGNALDRFAARPWSYADLETLGSVGALSGGLLGNTAVWGGSSGQAVDNWLMHNGVPLQEPQFEGGTGPDVGTREWLLKQAATFPTISQMRRLGAGRLFDDENEPFIGDVDTDRLDLMRPTPLGWSIGRMVLDHLVGDQVPP